MQINYLGFPPRLQIDILCSKVEGELCSDAISAPLAGNWAAVWGGLSVKTKSNWCYNGIKEELFGPDI